MKKQNIFITANMSKKQAMNAAAEKNAAFVDLDFINEKNAENFVYSAKLFSEKHNVNIPTAMNFLANRLQMIKSLGASQQAMDNAIFYLREMLENGEL